MNALWWWIDRWRKSTAFTEMTLAQQGAYRNLLDEATLRGGALPNDERVLSKASGDMRAWPKLRAVVLARFTLQADGWHNETLDGVLYQSERRKRKQATYRDRAGNAPGNEGGNAPGNAPGNETGNNPGNQPGSPDPDLLVRTKQSDPMTSTPSVDAPSSPSLILSPKEYARLREKHVYVGARLRIPNVLHDECWRKLGGAHATERLLDFYIALDKDAERSGEPIPDIFKWLRPKFEAWANEQAFTAELEKFRPKGA